MKVKFYINGGFAGCDHEDITEFDDDTTQKEIEEAYQQWVWEHISGNWEIIA